MPWSILRVPLEYPLSTLEHAGSAVRAPSEFQQRASLSTPGVPVESACSLECSLRPIRTHTHAHARTRTHAHTHTHARTCTRTRTYARAHKNACTHTRTRTHARAHAHARTRTQERMHAHTDGTGWPPRPPRSAPHVAQRPRRDGDGGHPGVAGRAVCAQALLLLAAQRRRGDAPPRPAPPRPAPPYCSLHAHAASLSVCE